MHGSNVRYSAGYQSAGGGPHLKPYLTWQSIGLLSSENSRAIPVLFRFEACKNLIAEGGNCQYRSMHDAIQEQANLHQDLCHK